MKNHNLSEWEQTQLLMGAITQFIEKHTIDDSFIASFTGLTGNLKKIGEYLMELFFHLEAQKIEQIQKNLKTSSLERNQETIPRPISKKITILLFDDNQARLHMLKKQLNEQRDMEVLASFESAHLALDACQRWSPNLVVMDMQIPEVDGVKATQKIVTQFPAITVVLVSEHNGPYAAFQAMVAGAKGYLTKMDGIANLPSRLRAIHNGDFIMNQNIRDIFLSYMHYRLIFTNTQMNVFGRVIEGKTRGQMEKELKMSPEALRQNIYRIGKILGVKAGEVGIREYFLKQQMPSFPSASIK